MTQCFKNELCCSNRKFEFTCVIFVISILILNLSITMIAQNFTDSNIIINETNIYDFNTTNKCDIFRNNQNRVFITYGGGTKGFKRARQRLIKEAMNTSIFTKAIGYYPEMIKYDKEFEYVYNNVMKKYERGSGYVVSGISYIISL